MHILYTENQKFHGCEKVTNAIVFNEHKVLKKLNKINLTHSYMG